MTRRVDQSNAAYDKGIKAYWAGKSIRDCPYKNPENYASWVMGFADARRSKGYIRKRMRERLSSGKKKR